MMKQVLFIRPDSAEDGNICWCESGSDRVETLPGWQALPQLADHPLADKVCLLLPASDMIFRHFSLAKKGLSTPTASFSWMAEETLIGDVDNLHWTVVSKKGREVDAVALDVEALRRWMTLFSEAGLAVVQVLPDALLLPLNEGGSTLVALGDSYWLRFSSSSACGCDAGLLPLLINKSDSGSVRCYGSAPEGVTVEEALPWQHPLQLIQPQWQTSRLNLLHGEFSPSSRAQMPGFRHGKKIAIGLVLLGMALLLGPRVGAAWMLNHQQKQLSSEMVEVAQSYFPSLRQTTNLKYHFEQSMKKVKKGFFLQLSELEQIRQAQPAVQINQLSYDAAQDQLTLNVKSMDQQALQNFVAQASEIFDFTMQPISGEAPYTAVITGKSK